MDNLDRAAMLVGDTLKLRYPTITEATAPRIAEDLTGFVAEVLQVWLNAGSERDCTMEEVGPTMEAHVRSWVEEA